MPYTIPQVRKLIPQLAAALFAGVVVLQVATAAGEPVTTGLVLTALLAVAQAAGTYLPTSAVAKAAAGFAAVAGSALVAAVSEPHLSTWLVVVGQVLAWAAGSVLENAPARQGVMGGGGDVTTTDGRTWL